MIDFTLSKYRQLLQALLSQGFFFMTFEKFLAFPNSRVVILRHDVDKLAENSLRTAKIEKEFGIQGTYYFRIVPESFDISIMEQIAALGHEIGYHYEDVDLAIKNYDFRMTNYELQKDALIDRAYQLFCKNVQMLRKNFDIKTICMHGSPRSKFDNKLIWTKYDYRELGILGEPYFDVDFSETLYLTDTGRRWDGERFSVRDKVGLSIDDCRLTNGKKMTLNERLGLRFRKTQDIIDAAEAGLLPDKIMITVHPQRWSDSFLPWIRELFSQNVKNAVKWGVVKVND